MTIRMRGLSVLTWRVTAVYIGFDKPKSMGRVGYGVRLQPLGGPHAFCVERKAGQGDELCLAGVVSSNGEYYMAESSGNRFGLSDAGTMCGIAPQPSWRQGKDDGGAAVCGGRVSDALKSAKICRKLLCVSE